MKSNAKEFFAGIRRFNPRDRCVPKVKTLEEILADKVNAYITLYDSSFLKDQMGGKIQSKILDAFFEYYEPGNKGYVPILGDVHFVPHTPLAPRELIALFFPFQEAQRQQWLLEIAQDAFREKRILTGFSDCIKEILKNPENLFKSFFESPQNRNNNAERYNIREIGDDEEETSEKDPVTDPVTIQPPEIQCGLEDSKDDMGSSSSTDALLEEKPHSDDSPPVRGGEVAPQASSSIEKADIFRQQRDTGAFVLGGVGGLVFYGAVAYGLSWGVDSVFRTHSVESAHRFFEQHQLGVEVTGAVLAAVTILAVIATIHAQKKVSEAHTESFNLSVGIS